MPRIDIPDEDVDEINSWQIEEAGVKTGSSPTEYFEVDSSTATREFFCRWDKRKDVFKWVLGWSRLYVESGVQKLSRLMPQKHPTFPGLVATKIMIAEGHKFVDYEHHIDGADYTFSPAQLNKYDKCRFKVLYEQVSFEQKIDEDTESELERYVWLDSPEPSADFLNFPGGSFTYQKEGGGAPSGISIPYGAGRVVPAETFFVVWERLPEDALRPGSPLFRRIYGDDDNEPYLGAVNDREWFGRPAGSCLFSEVRPIRRKSPTGAGTEITARFAFVYKPSRWNRLYYYDRSGGNSGSTSRRRRTASTRPETSATSPPFTTSATSRTCSMWRIFRAS